MDQFNQIISAHIKFTDKKYILKKPMKTAMEFLETYRGAALFKDIEDLNVPDEEVFTKKILSEGIHPELNNLKVELSAVGDSWKEAKKKVVQKIDQYLDEHDLKEFDFDELDLNE